MHFNGKNRTKLIFQLPVKVAGLGLTGGIALSPWARHFILCQENPSWHDWKIVDWDIKIQTKQNKLLVKPKLNMVYLIRQL